MTPLDLKDTAFYITDKSRYAPPYADGDLAPAAITGHMTIALQGMQDVFVELDPVRINNVNSYPSGGAGMAGTAHDVMRLLEVIRTGGAPILTSQSVEKMLKDQVCSQAETQGPSWGFGYGWAVLNEPALTQTPQAPGTIQWGKVYGHSWFVDRANGLTVVALTNTTSEGTSGTFPIEVRNAVYG